MKLYLFACATSIDTDELLRELRSENGDIIKAISLPCSGKIDVLYLAKAFETGADAAAVITCPEGDCRYLEGNLRAARRAEAVDGLLDEIGIGKGRIAVMRMTDEGMERLAGDIRSFIATIEATAAAEPK